MIDAAKLSDEIIENGEYIEKIICSLGYENIKETNTSRKCFRFSNPNSDERNVCVWADNLHYVNYSHGLNGNIFNLIMDTNKCSFSDALRWTATLLGITASKKKVILPFGGFYRDLLKYNETKIELTTYDRERLPRYGALSQMFFKDGVSYKVQEEYGISLDLETNKIIIPIEGHDSSLIGAKWRENNKDAKQRYGMYLNYPKSQVLFGFNHNYETIQRKNAVMLVEAEKSVMQGATFGVRNILACAGHQPSKAQIRLLQSLRVGTIIVGFDESIDEEEIEWNCRKIKSIFDTRVGFVYDKKNDVLAKGSKCSPTDLGHEAFKKLLREHLVWV